MMRRWLFPVLGLGLILAGPASGFRRMAKDLDYGLPPHTRPTAEYPVIHWDLRQFEGCRVPFTIGRTSHDLDNPTQSGAILTAKESWNLVEPAVIELMVTPPGSETLETWVRDGFNTIGWADSTIFGGHSQGKKYQIAALTFVWSDFNTGRIIEADTRLSDNAEWHVLNQNQEYLSSYNQYDVRTVATHEFGHLLGLDHPVEDFEPWDYDFNPGGNFPGPEDEDHDGDGLLDRPIMDPGYDQMARWFLHQDDRDGCNFLYNPDLGDAPDPWDITFNEYPSNVHRTVNPIGTLNLLPIYAPALGAEHLFSIRFRFRTRNYSYEWLGWPTGDADDFNGECESNQVDRDPYDDGVKLTPNPPVFRKPVKIVDWVRYAIDAAGNAHDYQSEGALYVNTWIDFDMDGRWEDEERVIRKNRRPIPVGPPNSHFHATVETTLVLPDALAGAARPTWLRTRLDWGEDVGDVEDRDGTLDQAEGAAQFGEVEDYPLRMSKPTRKLTVPNLAGHGASGLQMVIPGPPSAGQSCSQHATSGGCPAGGFGTPPGGIYDPVADETILQFTDGFAIPPGASVQVGRAQPGAPAQILRAFWVPESGSADIADRIPTTNAVAFDLRGPGTERSTRVIVGTVNDPAGGFLTGDPLTSSWDDSMYVVVTARVSETPLAIEDLHLCNPALTGLSPDPLGGGWITPETPFQAELSTPMTSGVLILEVESSWSVNPATSSELYQFEDVVSPATGAPEPLPAPPAGFLLRAAPTPSAGGVSIEFRLRATGRVSLGVYDMTGALRRTLFHGDWLPPGPVRRAWNGYSDDGRRLAAGVYFVLLEVDGVRESTRVVLLR